MKTYLECWIGVAKSLLSQALAGEPRLVEATESKQELASGFAFAATLTGDLKGGSPLCLTLRLNNLR